MKTSRITANTLYNATRINSIAGKEIGNAGKNVPVVAKIAPNIKAKMEKNKITEDEYLSLLVYAKHLPRGKQELKLNYKELRDQLISDHQEGKESLNVVNGLRRGGMVAKKGLKKGMSLKEHLLTIKNKNRNQTAPIPNVPYPYFKNSFKV